MSPAYNLPFVRFTRWRLNKTQWFLLNKWIMYRLYTSYYGCSPYTLGVLGGFTKPISSVPLYSQFCRSYQNIGHLWNITFIFGRCRRSVAAVLSVKYGCDLKIITRAFARAKTLLTENLAKGASVTLTPGLAAEELWTVFLVCWLQPYVLCI